jgi:hypothetical protein
LRHLPNILWSLHRLLLAVSWAHLALTTPELARAQESLPLPPAPSASNYEYILFEIAHTRISTHEKMPAGTVKIKVETTLKDPRPEAPADIILKVYGETVVQGMVPLLLFTANDCLGIGTDLGSPVSLVYDEKAPFKFTGKIEQVRVKYLN